MIIYQKKIFFKQIHGSYLIYFIIIIFLMWKKGENVNQKKSVNLFIRRKKDDQI